MPRDAQRRVVAGMASGAIGSAAFLYLGYRFLPPFVPVLMEPIERVAYAIRWLVLPAGTLVLGVALVAAGRFFAPDAIDGNEPTEGSTLDINVRFVTNTAEQLLLFAIALLALSVHLGGTAVRMIPLLTLWFSFARLAFLAGYHKSPIARAFGFAATFYPTVGALLYDVLMILS